MLSNTGFGDRRSFNWVTLIAFSAFHVLAVIALFYTTWSAVVVALVLHWICVGWGIVDGVSPPPHAPGLRGPQADRVTSSRCVAR